MFKLIVVLLAIYEVCAHGQQEEKSKLVSSDRTESTAYLFRQASCEDVVGSPDIIAIANRAHVRGNMEGILRFACEQNNADDGNKPLDCVSHARLSTVLNSMLDTYKSCSGISQFGSHMNTEHLGVSVDTNNNRKLNDNKTAALSLVSKPDHNLRYFSEKERVLAGCNEEDYGCKSTYNCLKACGGGIAACGSAIWSMGMNAALNQQCFRGAWSCFKNLDNCCGCAAYWEFIDCSTCDGSGGGGGDGGGGGGGGGYSPPPPPPPPLPQPQDGCPGVSCNSDGFFVQANCEGCMSCPPGTSTQGEKNWYLGCPMCSAGYYSTGRAAYCSSCPSGYHSNSGSSTCYSTSPPPPPPPCYEQHYCSSEKNAYLTEDCSSCQSCQPGSASFGNERNYMECEPCPSGKYSSGVGNRDCTTCPYGKMTTKRGSTECFASPTLYPTPVPCAPISDAEARCYLARYGDLRTHFGATNIAAAKQHYCDYGRKEGRDKACTLSPTLSPTFLSCSPGFKRVNGVCVNPCIAGQYLANGKCRFCPKGTTSAAGSTICSKTTKLRSPTRSPTREPTYQPLNDDAEFYGSRA
jgi:hypothetical protein